MVFLKAMETDKLISNKGLLDLSMVECKSINGGGDDGPTPEDAEELGKEVGKWCRKLVDDAAIILMFFVLKR